MPFLSRPVTDAPPSVTLPPAPVIVAPPSPDAPPLPATVAPPAPLLVLPPVPLDTPVVPPAPALLPPGVPLQPGRNTEESRANAVVTADGDARPTSKAGGMGRSVDFSVRAFNRRETCPP